MTHKVSDHFIKEAGASCHMIKYFHYKICWLVVFLYVNFCSCLCFLIICNFQKSLCENMLCFWGHKRSKLFFSLWAKQGHVLWVLKIHQYTSVYIILVIVLHLILSSLLPINNVYAKCMQN